MLVNERKKCLKTFSVSNDDPLDALLALDPLQSFFNFSLKIRTIYSFVRQTLVTAISSSSVITVRKKIHNIYNNNTPTRAR